MHTQTYSTFLSSIYSMIIEQCGGGFEYASKLGISFVKYEREYLQCIHDTDAYIRTIYTI